MFQGTGFLGERVLPRVAIPVAVALVVTVLARLTGWGMFDVSPWPWLIGALPLALLLGLRLQLALARHAELRGELQVAVRELRALGESLSAAGGDSSSVAALLRLLRQRFEPGALLADLGTILDEPALAQVRAARDPQAALIGLVQAACSQAGLQAGPQLSRVRSALDQTAAASGARSPLAPASDLLLLFLVTLPVGLVDLSGWWTFLAVGGVALAFQTLDLLAGEHERAPGQGPAWQGFGGLLSAAQRAVSPAPPQVAGASDPQEPAEPTDPEPS